MSFEHSSMHVPRLGRTEGEAGSRNERKAFSPREMLTTAMLLFQLQGASSFAAERPSAERDAGVVPERTGRATTESVGELGKSFEIREAEPSADWVLDLQRDPETKRVADEIRALQGEVPNDDHERGLIMIETDDGQYTVQRFEEGSRDRLQFSYSGLRASIASAKSVYVVHTHPFSPDLEASYSQRHPGDHVVVPPSLVDLFVGIRDVAWFPGGMSGKIRYVVVDDSGTAWRFCIPERGAFIDQALAVFGALDLSEAVRRPGSEMDSFLRESLSGSISDRELAGVDRLLRTMRLIQFATGKERSQLIADFCSDARGLGIDMDVSFPEEH
ncbi:MAG: hypothetical protein HGA38_04990 [Candidatus Moranbacteria bacterium]|nr:hypothetical protein [Candidatus Moranbacteria bacterium]